MNDSKQVSPEWQQLYLIGGISAIVFLVYSLVTMAIMLGVGGAPESAAEAFALLQGNKATGLLRLDLLTFLIIPFYYPIFLSVCIALRRSRPGLVALAALLAFAGVTLTLATPSALSMLSLSDKYAAASDPALQQQLLAAGEAIIASDSWHATGATIGGASTLIAALILSLLMLREGRFSRATAYVGALANGLDLVRLLVGFFAASLAFGIMAVAGTLYLVWFSLLARDLLRLGRAS
jgi:hypothetical protein